MNRKTSHFTLVEILAVIAVILILAGILLPALTEGRAKAEETQCRAQITTLLNALKQYEATYGKLPTFGETAVMNSTAHDRYEAIIKVLQGDATANDSSSPAKSFKNPKQIKFLEKQGNTAGEFKDPWDNDFIICIDATYQENINGAANLPDGIADSAIKTNIVIWSKGVDGNSKGGSAANTKDAVNEDNIYSVPTTWDAQSGHHISR